MEEMPEINYKDPEVVKKLYEDPLATHIPTAVLELLYDPYYETLDKRGAILRRLLDGLPEDMDADRSEIILNVQEVGIQHPAGKTASIIGLKKARFGRHNIVPGTLSYFFDRAKEQADIYKEILGTHDLGRIGIRVHQLNYIEEKKFAEKRFNFNKKFLQHEAILGLLKDSAVTTSFKESYFVYSTVETARLFDRALEYKWRIGAGITRIAATAEFINLKEFPARPGSFCFFTDLDFQIEHPKSFSEVQKLIEVANQRSETVHQSLLEAVNRGR